MRPLRSLSSFVLALLFLYVNDTQGIKIPTHGKVVTCYVASWAMYRPDGGKFLINNLKPEYCTHLIYSFAGLNATSWEIRHIDPWGDLGDGVSELGNYKKITALRDNYPGLKVSIAIGGWNEGSKNYSILAADKSKRRVFSDSIIKFLRKYKFDGLDLDWEFPTQRDGAPEDKQNFALLIEELYNDLSKHSYTLTAAISANKLIIDEAYDIPKISKYLDYIHVMAYDYHGIWDKKVLPNAPLYSDDNHCVDATIKHLLDLGAPPEKLVLGLPMYGRVYLLAESGPPDVNPIGKNAQDISFSGKYTREEGFMGFNEICEELTHNSWIKGWDNVSSTPYAVKGQQVVCYDNDDSLYIKALYANKKNLAGVMVWSIDTDDFSGSCGDDYILMKSINKAFNLNEIVSTTKRSNTGTSLSSNPLMYKWYFTSILLVFVSKNFI